LSQQSTPVLAFDFTKLEPLIHAIQSGQRFPGTTFFIYADIVMALYNNEPQKAIDGFNKIIIEVPMPDVASEPCRILPWDASPHQENQDMYARAMNIDSEPHLHFFMDAPSHALANQFSHRIVSGFKLMQLAVPELAEEFKALINDIVMVVGDAKADYQFDGGSSYFLWGTLFLNATSHQTDIAMVEVLAHESAHMLLYACAIDEPLVLNPDEDLYPSPLRVDLRPMDGIYHATFVSARMHWAMQSLADSGLLSPDDLIAAKKARDEDLKNFWAGHRVVSEHGELSATGKKIMQTAFDYMRQFN
jgi:HEXXH motif-containing protein